MSYQKQITIEQEKKLDYKLKNEMTVLIENGIMLSSQVDVVKDILIEAKIVTEEEFNDRTLDKVYQILSNTGLI